MIRTGARLWQAGVPLWTEIAPRLISRHEDLWQFLADTVRFFEAYVSFASLRTRGTCVPPQPIASFNAFVARLTGELQTDVLLMPRGASD